MARIHSKTIIAGLHHVLITQATTGMETTKPYGRTKSVAEVYCVNHTHARQLPESTLGA
jgi:hypothetical protein